MFGFQTFWPLNILKDHAEGLTEGIVQLFDSKGKASVEAVNAVKDHGDILRGAAGSSRSCGGAVVCVALV